MQEQSHLQALTTPSPHDLGQAPSSPDLSSLLSKLGALFLGPP